MQRSKRHISAACLLTVLFAGCATTVAAPQGEATVDAVRVVATANHIELRGVEDGSLQQSIPLQAELETLAAGGNLLAWMEDDDPNLHLALWRQGELERLHIPSPVGADALCLGPRGNQPRLYDLFMGDGDGTLFHFWLDLSEQVQLTEVRQLWTNPDVELCWLDDNQVIIDNGPLGTTAYAVNEENDAWLTPVSSEVPTAMLGANLPRNTQVLTVAADAETTPVTSSGDAADDPVVLVADPEHAWIVGTDKRWGLVAYDTTGQMQASINRGRLNNVDAVPQADGFLLAATNRTELSIDLFSADPSNATFSFDASIPVTLNDPYGLCMGRHNDAVLIFAGGTDGEVQVWQLTETGNPRLTETLRFDSQTEGCVYDARNHRVFVGEEAHGIWQVDLADGQRTLFAAVEDGGLVADVEGLDICQLQGERVIVASSQGDDSYVVFKLDTPHKGGIKFKIVADELLGIDGTSETDGLACSNAPIDGYPKGILVVQDGRNRAPEANQNFKIVDWRAIDSNLRSAHTR